MQRISLLFLTLIVSMAFSIHTFAAAATTSLDRRFDSCMSDKTCTTREELQILDALTDNMRSDLQRIDRTCMTTNYRNCFRPTMNGVIQWHKMHSRMHDMVQLLELQYTAGQTPPTDKIGKQLNLIEPAAGPEPKPNPYTNPDQEKLENDKQDWWQEWTPPDEANPYHKW
jgi:hypothetical protein